MRAGRASSSWSRSASQRAVPPGRRRHPPERPRDGSFVVFEALAPDPDGTGADHALRGFEGGAQGDVLAQQTVALGERVVEHLVSTPAFEDLAVELRPHGIALG